MKLLRLQCFALLFVLVFFSTAQRFDEYATKALFIERSIRFIEWPDSTALPDTFTIGFWGATPIQSSLEKICSSISVKNRPVSVVSLAQNTNVAACNVVFVAADKLCRTCLKPPPDIAHLIETAEQNHILTVCDLPDPSRIGMCMSLYRRDNRISFVIDQRRMHRTGLTASGYLLDYATVVNPLERLP